MDDVIRKTEEVLPLMNTMERLLESPEVKNKDPLKTGGRFFGYFLGK